MAAAYRYVLEERAFLRLRMLPADEQDQLVGFFRWLAANPTMEGLIRDQDASGRPVFYSDCGSFVVTHWADHAVREVRVVDIGSD